MLDIRGGCEEMCRLRSSISPEGLCYNYWLASIGCMKSVGQWRLKVRSFGAPADDADEWSAGQVGRFLFFHLAEYNSWSGGPLVTGPDV